MNYRKLRVILLTILFSVAGAIPVVARAADVGTFSNPIDTGLGGQSDIAGIFNYILRLLVLVGSIVIFFLFAIAGILYVTGAGNDDQIGKAKRLLIDGVIGLIILLAAYTLASFVVQKLLGVEDESDLETDVGPDTV